MKRESLKNEGREVNYQIKMKRARGSEGTTALSAQALPY
jgi:hypothetical protein